MHFAKRLLELSGSILPADATPAGGFSEDVHAYGCRFRKIENSACFLYSVLILRWTEADVTRHLKPIRRCERVTDCALNPPTFYLRCRAPSQGHVTLRLYRIGWNDS